jgi:hypothetical protein
MHLEIYSFLLDFALYLNIGFKVFSHDPLDCIIIWCDIPLLISNFINLGLSSLSSQIGLRVYQYDLSF